MSIPFGIRTRLPAIDRLSSVIVHLPCGCICRRDRSRAFPLHRLKTPALVRIRRQRPAHGPASPAPADSLSQIAWSTPVDLDPQHAAELGRPVHPLWLADDHRGRLTVIVPVEDRRLHHDGSETQTRSTSHRLPRCGRNRLTYCVPSTVSWTPSYSPTLTPNNRLFYAGQEGALNYIDNVNSSAPTTPTTLSFYTSTIPANNNNVYIDTPLTSDFEEEIFSSGYVVNGARARIRAAGNRRHRRTSI